MKLMKDSACNLCNASLEEGYKVQSLFRQPLRILCIKCANKKEGVKVTVEDLVDEEPKVEVKEDEKKENKE